MHKETLKRPGFVQPEEEEAEGNRANCCPQLLNGSLQPGRARLLTDVHSERMREDR